MGFHSPSTSILKAPLSQPSTNYFRTSDHWTSLERLNHSFITLVPKKTSKCLVKDFRPISLMNGIVKIISKALSLRLAKKLDGMIPFTQLAFIQKRNIADNFAAANDIISQSNRLRYKGMIYKVDFEKAFDNVAWHLLQLLSAWGFSDRWCRWISDIIFTTKSSIIFNGLPGRPFKHNTGLQQRDLKHNRGLQQGDPISPQPFILIVHTLDQILKATTSQQLIAGIGSWETTGQFQSLQFVDDTLIFSGTNWKHITTLNLFYTPSKCYLVWKSVSINPLYRMWAFKNPIGIN